MKENQRNPNSILVRLCEALPGDITFFERNGLCTVTDPKCHFAQTGLGIRNPPFCKKKTYTPLHRLPSTKIIF